MKKVLATCGGCRGTEASGSTLEWHCSLCVDRDHRSNPSSTKQWDLKIQFSMESKKQRLQKDLEGNDIYGPIEFCRPVNKEEELFMDLQLRSSNSLGSGGGLVVRVLAFYTDNSSSNPADD